VHLELCRIPMVNSLEVTNSTGIGTTQDALRLAQLNYNYLFPSRIVYDIEKWEALELAKG